MSEISLLIARKVSPESVEKALPRDTEGMVGPGFPSHSYYKRHWTGKMLLVLLYEDHEIVDPLRGTLTDLFAEGKIDRIEHDWTTQSGSVHGWFCMHGNWQRTLL